MQLGCGALKRIGLAHKQEVQREAAGENDDQRQNGQQDTEKRRIGIGACIGIGIAVHDFLLIKC